MTSGEVGGHKIAIAVFSPPISQPNKEKGMSWESKELKHPPPMPRFYPQEIAGLIKELLWDHGG